MTETVAPESTGVPAASTDLEPVASESQPDPEPWKKVKHKVVTDGVAAEIDYDELLTGYQKAKASDERFRKADATEKQMANFLTAVKQNPALLIDFAEQLGLSDQLLGTAEQKLIRKYEMEALKAQDPEKFELLMAKEERDAMKAAQEKQRQEGDKEKNRAELERFGKEIEDEIIQSLQEQGTKPTPRTIARAAEYLLASLDRPNGRLKASEAFQRVRQDYAADLNEYMQGISDEALMSFLGDGVRDRLRKHDVANLRKGTGTTAPKPTEPKPVPKDERPSVDDWFKKREQFFNNRKK
jgi:hypothetical protein